MTSLDRSAEKVNSTHSNANAKSKKDTHIMITIRSCRFLYCAAALFVASATGLMAAPVWDIPAERIEVSSPAQKYRVLVTTDENRQHALTGILVVWNGVEMKVPVHDLAGIEDVRVQSLRVVTDRPMRNPRLPVLNTRDLAVRLEYGQRIDIVDNEGNSRYALSRVFFCFTKFGYVARERHVPVRKTNLWSLFGKDRDKPEVSDGTRAGKAMESPSGWLTSEFEKKDDE